MTSTHSLVADSYDRAAKGFAKADQYLYRFLAAPLVRAVVAAADLGAGAVLDVAAGTGAVGRHFSRTVAVDLSLEQLRRNEAGPPVRANAEHLPFQDQCFAAAVCGFGVNHVADPAALVREMKRVAPVVGVSTWQRPEVSYEPKRVVFDVLARRAGGARSAAGVLIDGYTDRLGSVDAVAGLMGSDGASSDVEIAEVAVPWPGVDAYLDYRLSMPTSASVTVDGDLRAELHEALQSLPPEALTWRPRVIVSVAYR